MGIMDNIRKIAKYQKKRNIEAKLNRQLIKQTVTETTFYEEYSSFAHGLKDKLNFLFVEKGMSEVVLAPNTPNHAKYFERAMEDTQFSSNYNIKRTLGGEYKFRERDFSEIEEILKKEG